VEPILNLKQLVEAAKKKGPIGVAVVAHHDEATILAAREGLENGLAQIELFGDQGKIESLLAKAGLAAAGVAIYHQTAGAAIVQAAIQSVREGRNQVLMKGTLDTSLILRQVLDKTTGLNAGRLCSHLVVCEIPGFDRLLIITDGGLNIAPGLAEKVEIVKNAIDTARALGIARPKVAVLAAVEKVNPSMPATIDAACLAKMCETGEFGDAMVDGPFAFDNAISAAAAGVKGVKSEVAGRADIILVPTIEVGNALGKSLSYIGKSSNAGIVVGAAAPIVLPSRAGKPEAKWAALALGVLLAGRKRDAK